MQLSRGKTPTEAGLYTLPLVLGLLVSSTIIGAIISKRGKWKSWMILGASLLTVGLGLMGTVRYDTNIFLLFAYMALMGIGLGMVMQNLVLVVQNSVDVTVIGTSSASVAFFRSLGGAIGVSVLGAILGTRVADLLRDGLEKLGVPAAQSGGLSGGTIPVLSTLPAPIRTLVEDSYGKAMGEIFLVATPLALVALIAIIFLPNVKLGSKTGIEQLAEKGELVAPTTATGSIPVSETLAQIGVDEIGGAPAGDLLTADGAPGAPGDRPE
jgi:MFS family permease